MATKKPSEKKPSTEKKTDAKQPRVRSPLTVGVLKRRVSTARSELERIGKILANTRPDHEAVRALVAAAGRCGDALTDLAPVPDTESCVGLATRAAAPKPAVGVRVVFREKYTRDVTDLGRSSSEVFKIVGETGAERTKQFILESTDGSGFRTRAPGGHLKGVVG